MSVDNGDITLKVKVRNEALGYVDDRTFMWDLCCGSDGVMYHLIYKDVFDSGLAVDKSTIYHERPNWQVIKADVLKIQLLDIAPIPQYIDVDPYGTVLPFLDLIFGLPHKGKLVVAYHDFYAPYQPLFRKVWTDATTFPRLPSFADYIGAHASVLKGVAEQHKKVIAHHAFEVYDKNIHGYMVIEPC